MRQFWDYSFHEMGIYDLPATIDYVLAHSPGYKQLHYIGHSQGTTMSYVLGSERPDYMKKIKLMQSLAPSAFFINISPLNALIRPYATTIVVSTLPYNIGDF